MGWLDIFSQFIRVGSYLFMDVTVAIFWIYGELVTIYYNHLADSISVKTWATTELVRFSSIYPQLSAVAAFLCKEFEFVLLVNCTHATSCLFFYCDTLVTQFQNPKLLVFVIWDCFTISDCLIRLWTICQTADKIRLAVYSTFS